MLCGDYSPGYTRMMRRIEFFRLFAWPVWLVSLVALLCGLWGCASDHGIRGHHEQTSTTPDMQETEPAPIEHTDGAYIVHTDWMTFYFSKTDFKESDIMDITAEAVSVMADIRNYLKVAYTLDEAADTVCYFDSTYRNNDGRQRSHCFWNEKRMHCLSLDAFVHEYVHMISENNADLVYHPDTIFIEGLAEHVRLHFYNGIASKKYIFFKEPAVSKNASASEHQMICDLLSKNQLAYNAENYHKAFVALLDKRVGISTIISKTDIKSDALYIYKYYIGHVFVDNCIDQLGGLETFMSVYCDCVTLADVYGKTLDELIIEACAYNTSTFGGDASSDSAPLL